jgi:hypothetical protein
MLPPPNPSLDRVIKIVLLGSRFLIVLKAAEHLWHGEVDLKYFPSSPLEFASPCGNRFDFDINRSRGVSAPLQQTTAAFALWKCVRFPWSK